MKHLISIQSGDWYDEENDEKSVAIAQECGIEALDFNIDHVINPAEYVKGKEFPLCDKPTEEFVENFAPLKAAAEKYGIAFSQMHAPFPTWYEDNAAATDYLLSVVEKILAVCAFVGCPALVVHPYNSGCRKKDIEINLEMYRRLMPAAKKYGVRVCLENLFSVFKGHVIEGVCTNVEDACYLIDTLNAEAGEDVFGFCFDVGHALLAHKDLKRYVTALGHRIVALHLHENNTEEDLHYMPYACLYRPLSPTADWEELLDGLHEIGYKGNINFEMERPFYIYPKALHEDMMRFVAAIGRYFAGRIQG
jgi:sugar phosphate isomerase/epimerase